MIIIDERGIMRRREGGRNRKRTSNLDDFAIETFIEDWIKDKKNKEENVKKEEEKKKTPLKSTRNFTTLEWFLLLMLLYPVAGHYYATFLKSLN